MNFALMQRALGNRNYAARRFDVPWRLPDGVATVNLADLYLDICRAQDPNIPGFQPRPAFRHTRCGRTSGTAP